MNEPYKILFVVYTPFIGYLPKRMAELDNKVKLNGVNQVIVTPFDFSTALTGLTANTVHLIELHPDTSVSLQLTQDYFNRLETIKAIIESEIKIVNI